MRWRGSMHRLVWRLCAEAETKGERDRHHGGGQVVWRAGAEPLEHGGPGELRGNPGEAAESLLDAHDLAALLSAGRPRQQAVEGRIEQPIAERQEHRQHRQNAQ